MRCRGEGAERSGNERAAPINRHHANGVGQKGGEAGVHMRMMMIVVRRRPASPIEVGGRSVGGVVVTMLMAVVTGTTGIALRMFHRVDNTHDRRECGVQ